MATPCTVSVTGSAFVGGGGGSTTPFPPCTEAALSAAIELLATQIRSRASESLIIMEVHLGYSRELDSAALSGLARPRRTAGNYRRPQSIASVTVGWAGCWPWAWSKRFSPAGLRRRLETHEGRFRIPCTHPGAGLYAPAPAPRHNALRNSPHAEVGGLCGQSRVRHRHRLPRSPDRK